MFDQLVAHIETLKMQLAQCNTENKNVHDENLRLWRVATAAKAYFSQDRSKLTIKEMLTIDVDMATALDALEEKPK